MKNVSQIPRKPVTELIKDMIDGWRRGLQLSQSKIVARVVEAHKAIDGERVTEILFEEERSGRDLTHCQKINMQKVYRWLGANDHNEDGPGNMPANFLPSVLAALPMDLRIQLANDILAPCGLVAHSATISSEDAFDPSQHVVTMLKELPEAKKAAFDLTRCGSDEALKRAHIEGIEAKQALAAFIDSVEGEMAKRGTLRSVA